MNKHYIRTDINNNIVKAFSDAFETPLETDILIAEGGRHYHLDVMDGQYFKYKYESGEIVENTTLDKQNQLSIIVHKERKKQAVNAECKKRIEDVYPLEVQNSVALGIAKYANIAQAVKDHITDCIAKSDLINAEIEALQTSQEVIYYNINFEV